MKPSIQDELGATAPAIVQGAMEDPWWKGITRYQWIVLAMTSFGLMFDLMDATLLGLAMSPALRQLLGAKASTQAVGWYGGLITTIFLVGWSLGGVLFGMFADNYGRKSALMVTILLYSTFTLLASITHTWWQFAICQFMTTLGIGGEWGAGTALLAETWPERARVKGAIILQSASSMGALVASLINILVGSYSWRYIYVVGAFPGLLLLGLRWWVKESDRWLAVHQESAGKSSHPAVGSQSNPVPLEKSHPTPHGWFTLREIFSKELRRDTIIGASLASIVTFGFWSIGWFIPTMISEMLTQGPQKVPATTVIRYVSDSRILIAVGSIATYLVFLFMGTQWRRKRALNLFFCGAFVSTIVFLFLPTSLHTMMLLVPVMAFFVPGAWVVFPVYLPELYPTRLRGTGAGFCFTFGRAFSALGPTITGILVLYTGSFVKAMIVPAFIYLLGPIVLLYARETRGQVLQ